MQIVDAIEDGTKDTVQYLNDGSWVKLTNGGTFTRYLEELIQSDFIDFYRPYGKSKKETL